MHKYSIYNDIAYNDVCVCKIELLYAERSLNYDFKVEKKLCVPFSLFLFMNFLSAFSLSNLLYSLNKAALIPAFYIDLNF